MTNKQILEKEMKDLDSKMADNKKKRERNSFLFNLGSIFTGVLGACLLFGNPWFGIPLIGGAVALQLSRKMVENNSKASYNALLGQKEHISGVLKDGLNVDSSAMSKRKTRIHKAGDLSKKQEAELNTALGNERLANGALAISIGVAGLVANPLIALASLGLVGVKFLADQKFMDKHANYEGTIAKLNNDITDYNMGARIINQRNANARANGNAVAVSKGKTQVTSKGKQPVVQSTTRYSKADEEAVDAYVRSLEGQGENVKGVQKRKI